jgi:predicted transcriptional regulator
MDQLNLFNVISNELEQDLDLEFNNVISYNNEDSFKAQKRKTFEQIRFLILSSLIEKRKTINNIANNININWKTVEAHLTYLIGKGYVKEVFSSEYVRIFEITDKGRNSITLPKKSINSVNKHNIIGNNKISNNKISNKSNNQISNKGYNQINKSDKIEYNKDVETKVIIKTTKLTDEDYELSEEVTK